MEKFQKYVFELLIYSNSLEEKFKTNKGEGTYLKILDEQFRCQTTRANDIVVSAGTWINYLVLKERNYNLIVWIASNP